MRGWSRAALVVALTVVAAGPAWSAEALDDSWFVLTIADAHVGHAHRRVETARDGSIVTRVATAIEVRRLGEELRLRSDEEWRETTDGLPVAYRLKREMGTEETRITVRVDGGRLTVEKLVGGETFRDTLEFSGRLLFPEGQRRLHALRGFRPGDRYSYLVFDPDFEEVTSIKARVARDDTPRAPEFGYVSPIVSRSSGSLR